MLFCQFSKSESLRDVCNGLCSATGNLNHLGIRRAPKKSSLSYLNKHRSWQLFRDFYFELVEHFNLNQPGKRIKIKLKRKIYLLDSTTISLCLSVFDWAKYRTKKGAIKLHTLLDFDGLLPTYLHLTDGKSHDAKIAKGIDLPSGSVVVADRGYLDFKLLFNWHMTGVFCKEIVNLKF